MQLLSRFNGYSAVGSFRGAVWLHLSIILVAGTAVRWPLLVLAPFFTTDSRCCYYHYAANQLLAGQPFDSNMLHLPGYAAFLAAILGVTGTHTFAVVLVQHALGLATGILVYAIGRRLFHPLVGLLAALATVLDVDLALYEHEIMPETLFIFLMVSAMSILVLGLERYHWRAAAMFGLVAGLLVMVRPAGLMFAAVVVVAPQRGMLGARTKVIIAALASLLAVLLPVMTWNKHQYDVFALTSSMQRNILVRIGDDLTGIERDSSLDRLLQDRRTGDPLLGQIKATIVNHPGGAGGSIYGRLEYRFDLTTIELDRYLQRVAIDYVFADPIAYAGETLRRATLLLAVPPGYASATYLLNWTRAEIEIAGGPDQLGISDDDLLRDQHWAQAYEQATSWLRYGSYAGALVILAVLAISRYPGRAALLVASLGLVLLPAAASAALETRYRYPVVWVVYLLAAVGVGLLTSEVRATWESRAVRWRRLLIGRGWDGLKHGQLPLAVAVLVSSLAVLGFALAAGRGAFAHRSLEVPPAPTLGISSHLLSERLDHLDWQVPVAQPTSRLVRLGLPAQLSFDLVGPDGLVPDGRADAPLLLTLGNEVPGQVLKFVDLGGASGPTWDTTGWYQPLLVVRIEDGEYLSQHTDPRSKSLKLQIGDRLLVLAATQGRPVSPKQFGVLRLHLDSGIVLSYSVEAEPLVVPRRDTVPAPQEWLTQHAAAAARVAIVQRDDVRVVVAESAFSAAPWLIALTSSDRAAIHKWLHAETLARHAIQYVWVGNSLALQGEAATAVLDPTRLRPVLLQVWPSECPVRWRGLFVVATAAAATDAPLVPLTIPHPLAEDEFQGMIRFSSAAVEPLAPGSAATVSLDVTNGSTLRWYGTCSSPTYPVGVAVEGRRSSEAPWTLVGEALLTDDLPAGATAQIAVEITAPQEAGRYELRARLVQRPDRVSPIMPAVTSLVVAAGNDG